MWTEGREGPRTRRSLDHLVMIASSKLDPTHGRSHLLYGQSSDNNPWQSNDITQQPESVLSDFASGSLSDDLPADDPELSNAELVGSDNELLKADGHFALTTPFSHRTSADTVEGEFLSFRYPAKLRRPKQAPWRQTTAPTTTIRVGSRLVRTPILRI